MATKKSTAKKKSTPRKASAKKERGLTVKECLAQSQVLKMHLTIITILSCVVCALVVALVLALKD